MICSASPVGATRTSSSRTSSGSSSGRPRAPPPSSKVLSCAWASTISISSIAHHRPTVSRSPTSSLKSARWWRRGRRVHGESSIGHRPCCVTHARSRPRLGSRLPAATQLPYSLVSRSPVEDDEMVAALAEFDVSVVASAVLAGGALSGKYRDGTGEGRLTQTLDAPRLGTGAASRGGARWARRRAGCDSGGARR